MLREKPPGAKKRINNKLNQKTVNDVIDAFSNKCLLPNKCLPYSFMFVSDVPL